VLAQEASPQGIDALAAHWQGAGCAMPRHPPRLHSLRPTRLRESIQESCPTKPRSVRIHSFCGPICGLLLACHSSRMRPRSGSLSPRRIRCWWKRR
jgi:hypothetical protein